MSDYVECPSCGRFIDTTPTTRESITMNISLDKAREQLRALEAIIADAEELASNLRAHGIVADVEATRSNLRIVEALRETLHAALYCPVVP